MNRTLLPVLTALCVLLAGCTSGGTSPDSGRTLTQTSTTTRSSDPNSYTPPKATAVPPLALDAKAPKGEKDGRCPYIRAGLDEDPTSQPNVADIEGNRVGRTTLLTTYKPVGCRFYFSYADHHAVAEILPRTFATATAAHNAMVRTAQTGTSVRSYPAFVPGVDGINYRTTFYGPDNGKDWAFVFAKGTVMVVVHTDQDDAAALNALYLARAIVGKF